MKGRKNDERALLSGCSDNHGRFSNRHHRDNVTCHKEQRMFILEGAEEKAQKDKEARIRTMFRAGCPVEPAHE